MSRAALAAILSPLLSSIATILLAASLVSLPLLSTASFGSFLGGGLLLLIVGCRKIDWTKEACTLLLLVTALRGIAGFLFFIYGVQFTEASKVVLFTKIEPYFVLFWSWVLTRQVVSRMEVGLLTIHLIAAVIVSTDGDIASLGRSQLGDLFIIISMCLSGYSYHHSKRLGAMIGAPQASALCNMLGGFIVFIVAMALGFPYWDGAWSQEVIYFFLYVLLFYVIASPLWYIAIQSMRSWFVSAIRAIGPLAGVPFAWYLLGERLSELQLVAAFIVLFTSAWLCRLEYKILNRKEVVS